MSTSIDNAFIKDYEARVHHIFQRLGGVLRPSVRMKTDVIGTSVTFQIIGKGIATSKARNGDVTPMNLGHTNVEAILQDFYAADDVDKLDEAKTNIDERDAIAKAGAWALGRKVDDQIVTALDATTETTVDWDEATSNGIRNSLLKMSEAMDDNDVPNDGGRYGLLTPRAWSQAMTVEEFASSDYVGAQGLPLTEGAPLAMRWLAWNGIMWKVHSGLPGKGTATAKVFVYHKTAVGYATGRHAGNIASNQQVSADIWWNGDRQAHRITHAMSGGAALIDSTGVIEGVIDDTAAIATS